MKWASEQPFSLCGRSYVRALLQQCGQKSLDPLDGFRAFAAPVSPSVRHRLASARGAVKHPFDRRPAMRRKSQHPGDRPSWPCSCLPVQWFPLRSTAGTPERFRTTIRPAVRVPCTTHEINKCISIV